ncbi:uncharacterized protein PHACADRAFT_258643 [Phanerochaete carnosa HHB-10118-sp]|uniref:Uncharacterized protein n=1 Tax=Phanerochaete carnosa (strain HHB-10118-sp) TaxID=650164 RepID=K5W660_PHACS|nr:uncharacterized protein PHACADRAFT_258643 [Phanerochaete carnosa HHB-10118-sp]EKM54650.1 hypothetical protein PHACADRAFT_258643 [Phanerochaete carnosa HHB-10118-sp]
MTGDAERSQRDNIKGVPILLVDYLMTTALIMVTEVQEWLDRPQTANGRIRIPGSSQPAVRTWLAIIHGEFIPESPDPPSPTLTAVSSLWDESSNRYSSGAASLFSGLTTPSTPASSAHGHGSFVFPREEEIPPVPALPETVRALPYAASLPQQTYASFENLSSLTLPQPSASTSSLLSPALGSKRGKRPLPTPPILSSPSAPRPLTSPGDGPTSSSDNASFERDRPSSPASSTSSTSISRRSRVGRSLTIANMPPLQPPPNQALPLPPKLAQEFRGYTAPERNGETSASASASVLQAANPDPLPPDQEGRIRRDIQALSLSSMPSPPPPPPPPIIAYPSTSNQNGLLQDVGAIGMAADNRRHSYAESVYEQPPPAYDAIDFSLPQVLLPHR